MFDGWPESFPGVTVAAADLLAGLDVERASHADYAAAVVRAARSMPDPVALWGWSMGGLAVLQAAAQARPHAVVLLDSSPPAETQGFDSSVEIEDGAFDPEALYGPFPEGIRARPESIQARTERKRGISVPSLPCPSLVVYGDELREERGPPIARVYGSDELDFPGLDHWGLVLDTRVREGIARWLGVRPR